MDIFKRLLVENPKVLAEFVHANLEKKHIRLIGEMIQPPKEVKKRADSNRVFLYEVYIVSIAAYACRVSYTIHIYIYRLLQTSALVLM